MPPAMAGAFDLVDVAAVGCEIEEVAEDVKNCDGEPETVKVPDAIAKSGLLKISQSEVWSIIET